MRKKAPKTALFYSRSQCRMWLCWLVMSSLKQCSFVLSGQCLLVLSHGYTFIDVDMHTGFSPLSCSLLSDNWTKSHRKKQLAGYTNDFRERSPRRMYTFLLIKWQPAKRFTRHILTDGLLVPITEDRCNSKQQICKCLSLKNCTSVITRQKSL